MTPEQEKFVQECEARIAIGLFSVEGKDLCSLIRQQDAWIKRAVEEIKREHVRLCGCHLTPIKCSWCALLDEQRVNSL